MERVERFQPDASDTPDGQTRRRRRVRRRRRLPKDETAHGRGTPIQEEGIGVNRIAAIVLVLLWAAAIAGVWFYMKDRRETTAAGKMPSTLENEPEVHSGPPRRLESGLQRFERAKAAIEGFLNARSLEERLPFIRNRSTLEASMRNYHKSRPLQPIRFRDIPEDGVLESKDGRHLTLMVMMEDYSLQPVVLEDTPDGFKVDWESFTGHNPVLWDAYAADPPGQPLILRVLARSAGTGAVEHIPDAGKFAWVMLEGPGGTRALPAAIDPGSEMEWRIKSLLDPLSERKLCLELEAFPAAVPNAPKAARIRRLASESWFLR